jgi:hypothetical protein
MRDHTAKILEEAYQKIKEGSGPHPGEYRLGSSDNPRPRGPGYGKSAPKSGWRPYKDDPRSTMSDTEKNLQARKKQRDADREEWFKKNSLTEEQTPGTPGGFIAIDLRSGASELVNDKEIQHWIKGARLVKGAKNVWVHEEYLIVQL